MRIAYLAASLWAALLCSLASGCGDDTVGHASGSAGKSGKGHAGSAATGGGGDGETEGSGGNGKGGTGGETEGSGGDGNSGAAGGGETAGGSSNGSAGSSSQGSGCTGTPIVINWPDGWMDRKDNPETDVQGPWYTYKDARDTTTVDPAEKAGATTNCAQAHIEPKVSASTDWGAGFACDLNSEGGDSPVKNPVSKPFKSLCVDVTVEGGTVDLELAMDGQADADAPFGVPKLKNGPTTVDLTTLTKTTWGAATGKFDPAKLISLKFKMNSPAKTATDTKVCVNGISVEM